MKLVWISPETIFDDLAHLKKAGGWDPCFCIYYIPGLFYNHELISGCSFLFLCTHWPGLGAALVWLEEFWISFLPFLLLLRHLAHQDLVDGMGMWTILCKFLVWEKGMPCEHINMATSDGHGVACLAQEETFYIHCHCLYLGSIDTTSSGIQSLGFGLQNICLRLSSGPKYALHPKSKPFYQRTPLILGSKAEMMVVIDVWNKLWS